MPNITLDSILLPADMIVDDLYNTSRAKLQKDVTIAGAVVFQFSGQITRSGHPVTLTSGSDYAFLTRTQLDAVYSLADSAPNTAKTLTIPGMSPISVFFDFSTSPITASALQPGKFSAASDLFSVTLKMVRA